MKDKNLDHLIKLSKKTGDRLIILDRSNDECHVLLSIDDYENLFESKFDEDSYELQNLSDSQLIDKINRDIAIWRSNQEMEDEDFEDSDNFEDEDYFDHRFDEESDWSKVGDVLEEDKYNLTDDSFDSDSEDDFDIYNNEGEPIFEHKNFNYSEEKKETDDDIDLVSGLSKSVPFVEQADIVHSDEPISDDPVFLEEPLE